MISRIKILEWAGRYDEESNDDQVEINLGSRIRTSKEVTKNDLVSKGGIVDWKFGELKGRRNRILKLVKRVDDKTIRTVSNFALGLDDEDYRIRILTLFDGIGPSLASVILTFYDPHNYGVFDIHVWRELLGKEPSNLFTVENYLKLLSKLRECAKAYDIDVRVVEKALFMKNKYKSTYKARQPLEV